MITLKGLFFGLVIFFTLLTLFYGVWISADLIAIFLDKKGGSVKGNGVYVFAILAGFFWTLALS